MTTKTYEWGHGGLHYYEWHEVADACEKLTGVQAADEADAVQKLSQHFGRTPKIGYDEGCDTGYEHYDDYYAGGHNND